jgi:Transposase, Mutator family
VSTVAKQLDAVVAVFHARRLKTRYRVLMLDGVVLARRTGSGAIRRPVLAALGLRSEGKKEVVHFRLARSESAAECSGSSMTCSAAASPARQIGFDGRLIGGTNLVEHLADLVRSKRWTDTRG